MKVSMDSVLIAIQIHHVGLKLATSSSFTDGDGEVDTSDEDAIAVSVWFSIGSCAILRVELGQRRACRSRSFAEEREDKYSWFEKDVPLVEQTMAETFEGDRIE